MGKFKNNASNTWMMLSYVFHDGQFWAFKQDICLDSIVGLHKALTGFSLKLTWQL